MPSKEFPGENFKLPVEALNKPGCTFCPVAGLVKLVMLAELVGAAVEPKGEKGDVWLDPATEVFGVANGDAAGFPKLEKGDAVVPAVEDGAAKGDWVPPPEVAANGLVAGRAKGDEVAAALLAAGAKGEAFWSREAAVLDCVENTLDVDANGFDFGVASLA